MSRLLDRAQLLVEVAAGTDCTCVPVAALNPDTFDVDPCLRCTVLSLIGFVNGRHLHDVAVAR